jgi:hypothetical protein
MEGYGRKVKDIANGARNRIGCRHLICSSMHWKLSRIQLDLREHSVLLLQQIKAAEAQGIYHLEQISEKLERGVIDRTY